MCFGGGDRKPQVVSTGTQQITDKSWETLEPYIKNVLESSRSRFEDQLEKGYQPFEGGYEGRYEGPSTEELAAREGMLQQGLSGIAGTGMSSARPYYEAGLSALGSSMGAFGPQQAQQYMNPYQQAVVDVAKREAVRSAQPTFRGIGDRAESVGAFGGSRQAIAEAEANRNLQQQLGDIQTTGMQQAFQQGRGAFEAQKAREAAGAARLFGQAPAAWQQGIREMGAVEEVGRARRGDEQAKKDFLYEQFEAEKGFPSQVYGEHLGHVRGFPYQPSMYKTTSQSQPRPGLGRQLLGAGMGLASMGKNLNLFQSGGQVQGGLSGLVEHHQNNQPYYPNMAEGYIEEKEDVDVTSPSTTASSLSELLMGRVRKREGLSAAKKLLKKIDKTRQATYGPEWRAKEQERIKDIAKDQAWTELGRLGMGVLGAEGHKDFLQAVGETATQVDTFGKFGEAQERQRIAQKEFDKRDITDLESQLKSTLGIAEIESKEEALMNEQLKNMIALAKANKVDLKELERFAKVVADQGGAVSSPDRLRAIKKFTELYSGGMSSHNATAEALKELKIYGGAKQNPGPKGKAEDVAQNIQDQLIGKT